VAKLKSYIKKKNWVNSQEKRYFQVSFFLGITTLLSQTKSTLLLKNKCNCTIIYIKTQCFQTNEMQHCLGNESDLGARGGVERSAN